MAAKVCEAIGQLGAIDPFKVHNEVKSIYTWHDVAARTERVYRRVSNLPDTALIDKLKK